MSSPNIALQKLIDRKVKLSTAIEKAEWATELLIRESEWDEFGISDKAFSAKLRELDRVILRNLRDLENVEFAIALIRSNFPVQ